MEDAMKDDGGAAAMTALAWAGGSRGRLDPEAGDDEGDGRLRGREAADAVDYLREVTGLNLVVLPKALEKEGDTKIRLKVKDLSV
jgi:hypothetical protein